ncbi:15355_t:CDS:1, partial [Gigaspora rosea]
KTMKFFTIIFLLVLANLGSTQGSLSDLFNNNPFNNFTSQCLNATVTIISEPEFAKCINVADTRPLYEKKIFEAIDKFLNNPRKNFQILEATLINLSTNF